MICSLFLALSVHILPGNWNAIHPGRKCTYESYAVGAYVNSESRVSPYVSYTLDYSQTMFIEVGLVGGYTGADVLPMLRLGYRIDEKVNLFVSPAYAYGTVGVVLGVELGF